MVIWMRRKEMEKKVGTSVQRIIKFGILAGFSALYSRPSRPLKKVYSIR